MIEVKSLSKAFDTNLAVDHISFSVAKGEVLGFLGPNGAGKSTTMKMLTCFLAPTSGDALVVGNSILTAPIEVKRSIGYMPENAPLYEDLSVEDFLHFVAETRGMNKNLILRKTDEVIQTCALNDVRYALIETLSKGFKRRVSLAQALIHDPQVLILDEPTDGLDPNQKHDVRKLIKALSQDKCIILSTHILEEVEAVCSRAIIISNGKIEFDGTPEELKLKSSAGRVDDVFRAITTGLVVEGVQL